MARLASAPVSALGEGLILAPERYDPARRSLAKAGRTVADVALLAGSQISAKSADAAARYLILDTGDAREGIVAAGKAAVGAGDIRSPKKALLPGDIIISRLRPYLKQVAVVDEQLWDGADQVLCSTEFYVLRGKEESLAYLVPWLLSVPVQAVLAAAQEGGHHPRFPSDVLSELPVPDRLWKDRETASQQLEQAVRWQRQSERAVAELVDSASSGAA